MPRIHIPLLLLPLMIAAVPVVTARAQPVSAPQAVREYPAEKVAPNTYVIHGPLGVPSAANQGFMNNPGFVITANGVVLIDPGSSVQAGRMVVAQLRKLTAKPVTHVINTHVHGDHWLGNQAVREAFPKAVLIGHPDMIREARAVAGEQWIELMERMTAGYTKGTRAVPPTVGMGDQAELKAGGITFRILATPNAHSRSDIMVHVVEESVLFGGDNVLYKRFGRLDDATFRGSIAALRAAAAVNARRYVPGHGPTGGVEIVKAYETYLTTLYTEVKKHHEKGRDDFQMKDDVVDSLRAYADWADFKEVVGKHISLAVLEIEKE
jgi:glyoxylase-like metal-dependent hydrolase (beta-lactamase superfamily II)